MKKIVMTKYGFTRCPEEDFSDDGNRFYGYRAGRVVVTKLICGGEVYISANGRLRGGTLLPHEVYMNLPHFTKLDALNGAPIASLTDNDLLDLCETCLMYEKEYSEAEARVVFPSADDVRKQCVKIKAKRMAELAEVEAKLASNITRLALTISEWQWKAVREYLVNLKMVADFDVEEKVRCMTNTSDSFTFVKNSCHELDDSFYYKWLMDLFKT